MTDTPQTTPEQEDDEISLLDLLQTIVDNLRLLVLGRTLLLQRQQRAVALAGGDKLARHLDVVLGARVQLFIVAFLMSLRGSEMVALEQQQPAAKRGRGAAAGNALPA